LRKYFLKVPFGRGEIKMSTDYDILRNFVTGGVPAKQQGPEGQVRLDVTSSVLNGSPQNTSNNWKNFATSLTIRQFKEKLQMFVGTSPEYQQLQLYDPDQGQVYAHLDHDDALLSSYYPKDGTGIYVIDKDPHNTIANYQDISQVKKYEMSDEDYAKRTVNYKKWKEENPDAVPKKEKAEEEPVPSNIKIGNRCEMQIGGRRGTVLFVGKVDFAPGYWVGVKLDEPMGKNDGTVQGKRYFECPDKYGSFVKVDKLNVGDFPERSIDDEI